MYPYDAVNIWSSENSPVTIKKFRLGGNAATEEKGNQTVKIWKKMATAPTTER